MPFKRILNFILFTLVSSFLVFSDANTFLYGEEKEPLPLFCIGGGYLHAGSHHTGGVFQLEYRWGKYIWHHLRPQITLITPEFRSFYLGVGIGWEFNLTDRITVTPSFSPGFYFKGKKGRDLGFPIEFRSSIELSYKLNEKSSIGFQVYHLSNARLSHKNPGMNAFVAFFAFSLD